MTEFTLPPNVAEEHAAKKAKAQQDFQFALSIALEIYPKLLVDSKNNNYERAAKDAFKAAEKFISVAEEKRDLL